MAGKTLPYAGIKPGILFCVFFLLSISTLYAQQLAFPGAQGGGRFAIGGRTGTVYEVTNLNDSGAGSLRDAVSQANRTVIFKVSGTIHLGSRLTISKNNITIAGQTAPGDGICVTGNTFNIKASDIIVRYIRCRLTDLNDIEDDAMNSFSGNYQNIIIDHCSLSWSVDETGTFYDIKNFTLQWCLLSESLYHSVHNKGDHGYAGIWGGTNASFHHNLIAHHTSRNPRFGGSRYSGRPDLEVVDFRNNVLYNWGNINSVYGGEGGNYNMVNNYYKPGPATPGSLTTSSANNKRNRILNYTSFYYATDAYVYPDTLFGGKFYIDGNYVEGYPDVTADNWTNGVQRDGFKRAAALMQAARQTSPFVVPPIRPETAQVAYASVLDSVGAILPRRDAIDQRIVRETRTGTATYEGATYATVTGTGISHPSGIIDTQSDAGGLPTYNSTTAPTDTDHDGIPDAWELANSLDQNNSADGNIVAANGFTNLENYLNSIVNTDMGVEVLGTLTNFVQTVGSPTAVQTYTISGVNLTAPITITPPVGYEVSANGGANWFTNASPLNLTPTNGRVLTTNISVRLNGSGPDSYSGYINNETAGIAPVAVAVKGITSPVTVAPSGVAVTVAKDGSGNFTTVQAAIDAAPTGRVTPYIIFIKNGKYKEKITVPSNKPFLQLVGESVANTILTFDDYSGKPIPGGGTFGTSNSASVTVNAPDFSAINITFENSTGDAPQALAINVNADRAAFKNCRFLGGQDTVLTNGNGNRQYFRNCYIDGVVDFIFGNAIAVFDSCVVHAKTRQDGLTGSYLTAANTQNGQPYGYVFRGCTIPSNAGVTKYVLGRPWQNSTGSSPLSYPKVVFINTTIGYNIIKPEGWAIWDAGTITSSIYDAEYKSKKFNGNLVDISQRISWSVQLTDPEAANYANTTLFGTWDPCTLSSDFCTPKSAVIAVTNFLGKKGVSTTAFSWNSAWPKKQVKYELFRSSDNLAFSKVNEQVSVNDTTIIYSYAEPIPPAGSTYYYYVKASKAGFDPHLTETIQVSSTSTITAAGSLNNFLQGVGLPSSQQAYTISGVNLVGDITITPPPGFEISANGGTTWFTNTTPLVLTQSGGTVSSKTITVRLNAATAGSYSGNILHSSSGAATVTVAANGLVQSDPLPVSVTLLYWPMTANNNDVAASRAAGVDESTATLKRLYTSNGTTVATVPAYSTLHGQAVGVTANGDGSWSAAAGGPGGNLSRRFYEQFTITALPGYTVRVDSISLSSSFYNTSSNTKLAVVYSKSGFTAADSTDVTGGVSGGIPLVSTANGAFATPIVLINETSGTTKNYKLALAGSIGVTLNPGQTLFIRAYFSCGSTSAGRYAKVKNVYIKGVSLSAASLPLLSVNGVVNDFTQTVGAPSTSQIYTVSGSNLTSNLTITPPPGYEVSSDGGITWFTNNSPLALTPVGSSVASTSIRVRLNAIVAGPYSGNIVHTSTGASATNVAVYGTTVNPPAIVTTGTLTDFSQTVGSPSVVQTYTVSGSNLNGNLTITPPAGYEVSADGGTTWSTNGSPLALVPTNNSVSNTSIKVRLNASAVGPYSGNITHASTGAATRTMGVSGATINQPANAPTITTTGTLADFSQTVGSPSANQSYAVAGTNLTNSITVVPPPNFEVSKDGTSWFNNGSSLTIAPSGGTVVGTTISVRLNASVSGPYQGTISHSSTGASAITVAVKGATSDPVTAIGEGSEQVFSISPNPAHTIIIVHHPNISAGTISIYTATGIRTGSFTSAPGSSETMIDVKSMANGFYFVQYIGKDTSVMMRFIKQ
jgi:pectin methylesterase-like acyl-CoA thioesterase